MPRKELVLASGALVVAAGALALGGAAFVTAWMQQPVGDPAAAAPPATPAGPDVAGVTPADGDLVLDLAALDEGGNTQVVWRCGKVLLGQRHDYAGAWRSLVGRALVDPAAGELRAGELLVSVGAMRGHGTQPAPGALINTVLANRWFLVEEYPQATLLVDSVNARQPGEEVEGAVDGWTHTLGGRLAINGIERAVAIPARVEVGEASLLIDATFPVSRSVFEVGARQGFEPPAEVDDAVVIEVRVRAAPDPGELLAELNDELVAQAAAIGALRDEAAATGARVERLEASVAGLERDLAAAAAAAAAASSGGRAPGGGGLNESPLPARFTDRVDYTNPGDDPRYRDLGYTAEFEMALVPGDPARGIAPFYAQTTEVTWDMFRAWSYCMDIGDVQFASTQKETLLRPSPCYDDASRGFGFFDRPVLGASRRNALAFCRHVSEQTGRSYRLWTDEEWRHVVELTGGLPEDVGAIAWLADTADTDDFGDPLLMPVGKKPADALGLHDVWGNVAEWVMADEQYVRGGSFLVDSADLSLEWREDESQDVWNMTYPNTPKSLWWYRDRFDMGFRLVCDAFNLPDEE